MNVDPVDVVDFGSTMTVGMPNTTKTGMLVGAYDEIPTGRAGLVVDSSGLLSLAVARGSAAVEFGLDEGDEIRLSATDGTTARADSRPGGATIPVDIHRKGHHQ